ncbi:MAG TPA: calcium/proton exchanger [Candidatus Poseidoniales archaeon]|nr:MAG: calcium/proton exchanger [Euryarchaeota archaeon]HIF16450.1 calcium/proton exchanger [Candidatus Poseidoniales archaeon]
MWMLFAIPIAVYFEFSGQHGYAFIASMLAIMPLAWLMGKGTEEIAFRTSESLGGLLNATFGNAVEVIIGGLALYAAFRNPELTENMITVVQASLIGSILGNLLLVLGLAFLWGGLKHKKQQFNAQVSQTNGSLLLLALIGLVIPAAFAAANKGVSNDSIVSLSRWTALVLLAIYCLNMLFQLKTHATLYATDGHHDEEAELSQKQAITLLLVATLFVAWMAHILVGSIEHAAEQFNLPYLFIGVILLPFFGNAAEHMTAVSVARKDKMDMSISIAVGSSIQIALLVAPFMVLLGWVMGVGMSLQFGLFETITCLVAVLITNFIIQDGESNWFEGVMLIATYLIIAMAFLYM